MTEETVKTPENESNSAEQSNESLFDLIDRFVFLNKDKVSSVSSISYYQHKDNKNKQIDNNEKALSEAFKKGENITDYTLVSENPLDRAKKALFGKGRITASKLETIADFVKIIEAMAKKPIIAETSTEKDETKAPKEAV
ncbi:hypothetical protein [Gaoshiqia sediminis]|uniref:Uncharacterized protein n=1 Tax=Gaoshiqia sediminis TaxID=2986998 RepID=A0AA42CB92_9BACT|nr:hypothetical protein [Gaoshiqia sediminis]MCW0484670.1 hypothetical protein [Gaoshiqia sediminis]